MGKHRDRQTVTGGVRDFNLSPKGAYEGVLIDTAGGVVQVNFPPAPAPPGMTPGQPVTVVVEPDHHAHDHPPGDHPVHSLVVVLGREGEEDVAGRVAGTVVRLNYARHGEANGVVLDTGDFIHLKPDGMRRAGLVVGQRIEAEGEARPAANGGRVVEATVVNGVAVRPGKKRPA
jgi:hypothetical protein